MSIIPILWIFFKIYNYTRIPIVTQQDAEAGSTIICVKDHCCKCKTYIGMYIIFRDCDAEFGVKFQLHINDMCKSFAGSPQDCRIIFYKFSYRTM